MNLLGLPGVVALQILLVALAGPVEAATAVACTYEAPVGGGAEAPDPSGGFLTGDGEFNLGGCVFDAPPGGSSGFAATITDSVFGSDIGGFICVDNDNDGVCGDASKGEAAAAFCYSSPSLGPISSGGVVAVFVDGPLFQGFLQEEIPDEIDGDPAGDCTPTDNPVGGTRGTIVGVFA